MANNKPVPTSLITGLATVATTGSYTDLSNLPTVISGSTTGKGIDWILLTGVFPTGGIYRLSYYVLASTADLTAGAVYVNIQYTDNVTPRAENTSPCVLTTLGSFIQGTFIIQQAASGSYQISTGHTGIYGTARYDFYATIEKIV